MTELPSGTVTFLFTDIEGSTRLLAELRDRYAAALAEHRRVMREAIARHGGVEVDTQGDAFFVAFARASDAVAAAAEAQAALELPVRMGLHTGEPTLTEEGYVGIDVHRAARIAAAGNGGQVLLSRTTRDLVEAAVRDLGDHRLKDLSAPERLFQLGDGKFPRLKTLRATNLPVQPTPLVGRERELRDVVSFVREGTRVVTLTGAGGSGKTRLALHAAAELAEDFPDGVWFVSLATETDPSVVETTVAEVAGAEFRSKHLLLVLDNLEQLLPEMASIVADLRIPVIATSRERLALRGEQEYDVPPLAVGEGVELFVERARRLVQTFEPDDHVVGIVRRLDGLPLAIELAAARVKVLETAQIEDRLGRSLDLLTTGPRDAPERQRTLRATIEWSYRLLSEREREIFASLAVFAGGFTADAAEAVTGASLDELAALVDKSLVRRVGSGRLFLLGPIREFAIERLSDAAEAQARDRHADWVEGFVERAPAATGEVEQERANVRAALAWRLEHGPARGFVTLTRHAARHWEGRLSAREALSWLERAAEAASADALDRGLVLLRACLHARRLGELEKSLHYGEHAVELFLESDAEPAMVASAYTELATTCDAAGDADRARAYFRSALEVVPQHRGTTHNFGTFEMMHGDYTRARELLEESLRLARAAGDPLLPMLTLHSLGDVALREGNPDEAERCYRESLNAAVSSRSRLTYLYCFLGLAAVAATRGDVARAGRLVGAADAMEDEFAPPLPAERAVYEAALTAARGNLEPFVAEGRALDEEAAVEYALSLD